MLLTVLDHEGKEKTGRLMYHFAKNYCSDLDGLERLPFPVFYSKVTEIPYRSDDELFRPEPKQVLELVARPKYLLDKKRFSALDCKKKSILCGAWAAANKKDFRFLAISELQNKKVHHVALALDYRGNGLELVDPTLAGYRLGQRFPITYIEELIA